MTANPTPPPPAEATHGFLSVEQIFDSAIPSRFFTILGGEPSPVSSGAEPSFLATDCPRFDLLTLGVPTRSIPRNHLRPLAEAAEAELPGQLGFVL